eukprot:SAG11_NODE_2873_length_2880_cov_9.311399_3_plen_313_part_01
MLMIASMMPLAALDTAITNIFFTNLSSITFTADQRYLIAHGLNFIPSKPPLSRDELRRDYSAFSRRIYCHDYFTLNAFEPQDTAPPDDMMRFRIPNPGWHPLNEDYEPSPGVLEYVHETLAAVYDCADKALMAHKAKPIYNLQRRHRDALRDLIQRRDIVFIDSDKNLGLVCLDTDDYKARCIAELAQTHAMLTPLDPDPLDTTRKAIIDTVLPLTNTLPEWAELWTQTAAVSHPKSGAAYKLPSFRLTIKVHKSPPEGRPITGNHCWITQPLAELVAALIQPFVHELPVFTKDTDQINRELLSSANRVTNDT